MHHHSHTLHKMNDLSSKTMHAHNNGYGPNMQQTIAIKPIIKNKSIGFAQQKQTVKYATTKSLPSQGSQHLLQDPTSLETSVIRNQQRQRHHSQHGSVQQLRHSGHHSQRGPHSQRRPHSHIGHHSQRGHQNGYQRPGSVVFKRQLSEKKENLIALFNIELEKVDRYIYKPGDEVKGCVQMDIAKNIEIRFLELIVVGQGCTSVNATKKEMTRMQKEIFLCKRTYVIGTPDSRWSSVLTPGHYISNFKVKLPKDLPSTTIFKEISTGLSFDINYFIKARICDDIGSASMRSIVTNNNAVKVLISKKQSFLVQRPFDIHQIPNSMQPVEHEEELVLSCGHNSVARFTLGLDRAVFLAGDDIKLILSCQLPSSQRLKDVTCVLRQHIALKEIGDKQSSILSEMTKHNPNDMQTKQGGFTLISLEVMIPTHTHLLSPFLVSCKTIRVAYTLEVVVKLQPAGGKVSFTMPIAMGPCVQPVLIEKPVSKKFVPVFNRPVRFPCFSPSDTNLTQSNSKSSQSINVVTVYNNSAVSRCFLCCLGGTEDN